MSAGCMAAGCDRNALLLFNYLNRKSLVDPYVGVIFRHLATMTDPLT